MSGYNGILELGVPRSPTSVGAKLMPLQDAETLRDRFAMAALDVKWKPEVAARKAYEYADAMMEARK